MTRLWTCGSYEISCTARANEYKGKSPAICSSTTLQSAQREVSPITSRNGKRRRIVPRAVPSKTISWAQRFHRRRLRRPPKMFLPRRNDRRTHSGCGFRKHRTISPALAAHCPALNWFMEDVMRATMKRAALIVAFFLATWPYPVPAQTAPAPDQQQPAFTSGELVGAGQQFFGTVSRGLASTTAS
jgi:hypothetical protein